MENKKKTQSLSGLFSWIFWMCGVCKILGSASSPAPSVTQCELLEHANITCYWTAAGSDSTIYILSVNMTSCLNSTNYKPIGFCTTAHTQCSVSIGSVSHCFCVDVLASSPSGTIRSARHCLVGVNEVKMYPPQITKLIPIPRKANCLRLEWTEDTSIYLQTKKEHGVLQIEYSTSHQDQASRVSTAFHDWKMELCGLYPGTKHYVRVRAQDSRAPKHWSSWSGVREATTAEAAPSATPELWRHIQPSDKTGQRHITVFWKPLQWPDSNGVVLRYAVSCWSDSDWSHWDCGYLNSNRTSCVLAVSSHVCTCNLTASNSAGTSPPAHLHIPADTDTSDLQVPPPPLNLTVTSLADYQLKVEWTAAVHQSEASFVVEWYPIPDNTAKGLHWEILNGSARSFIITDGVLPEVPYNVSVKILYKKTVEAVRFSIAFTRQGVPSVGPTVEVVQVESDRISLRWKAVPLEKLCGFIQNYTLIYKTNGKVKYQVLGGDVEEFSLSGLSAGEYTICVKAHTLAGGAEGPWVTVAVGHDYVQLMAILLCAVGTLLILVILLSQVERIQQQLCPAIPDPSKSSLSTWPPVSPTQNKLTVLDFRPSPSLFELIYLGGIAGHHDHHQHHHDLSQVWSFNPQSVPTKPGSHESKSLMIFQRPVLPNTDKRETEQTLNSPPPADGFTEDLIIDPGIRSKSVAKPQPPSLLLSESYIGVDLVDFLPCWNTVPALDPCSQIQVSSRSPPNPPVPPESSVGVDAIDLVYQQNVKSRQDLSEFSCNSIASSASCYLPVSESYVNIEAEAKDPIDLLRRSKNSLSEHESCCYTHLSTTYLPIPEPSRAFCKDLVTETVNSSEGPGQTSLKSNCSNLVNSVSSTYIPFPVLASADKRSTETVGLTRTQQACQSPPICTDSMVVDTYRILGPEECPLLLQFSLQNHSTKDSTDLLGYS
ncbi:interleukin-31 receptor subunit alpha isoform X1 [Astyanax mexicanus]|uniref:interleukin-31 receptor subunit alpha isoform X1 n=1 Tax=Astyanax mexicanus TaxID=7994 RepID=UPI0020CAD177|nr:interleukin-31 receptor subunit alpha isoform X1 [Astyanax mexicanus]